jgi:DNA-binding transcriptional ArsR family regulator
MENNVNIQALFELERNLEVLKMNSVKENKDSLLFDEPMTSKRLGIEYSTLKLLRKGGLISDVRIGRRIFYRLSDIENFISRREVEVVG